MSNKIELFKMLLARNEINRQRWNSYQRYAYAFKRKNKDILKRQEEFEANQQALYDFTAETYGRRQEFKREFNTLQRKSACNKVESISVNGKRYWISDMKRIIEEYEIEQILLGGNS